MQNAPSSRALATAQVAHTPRVQLARLPTGVDLPYAEHGPPEAAALVFLHGYTDSRLSFQPIFAHLPNDIRALALTQRGHGDATRPSSGYQLRDFANDLRAFLDHTAVTSAVIVGHSMGAHIAQQFAADYPERTSGLVLEAAFYDFASNVGVQEMRSEVARLGDPIDPQFARAFQESTLAQPVDASFIDLAVAESCKCPARVWQAVLDGLVTSDLAEARRRIERPTLLVWGAADAFVSRADQAQLLAAIPGAALREYAKAGHAVHWEEPARFAADVAAFARRHAARA
jgi:non-heme chloroperoxidase